MQQSDKFGCRSPMASARDSFMQNTDRQTDSHCQGVYTTLPLVAIEKKMVTLQLNSIS